MADADFKHRMFLSLLELQRVTGRRVTQAEVGKAAGMRLSKGKQTQASVSRHFHGRVPDLQTILAYALEMGVDPGWLAFGELSQAPAPHEAAGAGRATEADSISAKRAKRVPKLRKAVEFARAGKKKAPRDKPA